MKSLNYQYYIGATATCTKHMMETTKGMYWFKDDNKYCFLFHRWFSSKRSPDDSENLVAEFIGLVKKSTKDFCKVDNKGLRN